MVIHMVASNLHRTPVATALSNAEDLDAADYPYTRHGRATLVRADCMRWLRGQAANSIEAVVTDPPYGLLEYTPKEQAKLRRGRGGV